MDLPVHTLIGPENKNGSLLLCGINHGYSKEDERLDAAGVDRSDPYKSFFSDKAVNDYKYRNTLAKWFSLWGYELGRDASTAGQFERSIVQTNWLQSCSGNVRGMNIRQACIDDSDSFLKTCEVLKPGVIFFVGSNLLSAFLSPELSARVNAIFGSPIGETVWLQKDVVNNGRARRRFKFGFQNYEKLSVVSMPHATGSAGIADDYIHAFKPEVSGVVESWWAGHKSRLATALQPTDVLC